MGERTFLRRVAKGLGLDSRAALARHLGVKEIELAALEAAERRQLPRMFEDPLWSRIADLVDERIGLLMAAREELNAKLAADRAAQLARRAAIRER